MQAQDAHAPEHPLMYLLDDGVVDLVVPGVSQPGEHVGRGQDIIGETVFGLVPGGGPDLDGIAQDLKKDVKYETEGLELQVDKTIAKSLAASLVHVVRNACDHGIESMEGRRKKGKSPVGIVRRVSDRQKKAMP